MIDKTTKTRISGRVAYIYDSKTPSKAKFVGHHALNNEGQSVGIIGLEHKGTQNPTDNLCALSQGGKYNYPSFARLKPAIEVKDVSGKSVGFRFEYI